MIKIFFYLVTFIHSFEKKKMSPYFVLAVVVNTELRTEKKNRRALCLNVLLEVVTRKE